MEAIRVWLILSCSGFLHYGPQFWCLAFLTRPPLCTTTRGQGSCNSAEIIALLVQYIFDGNCVHVHVCSCRV